MGNKGKKYSCIRRTISIFLCMLLVMLQCDISFAAKKHDENRATATDAVAETEKYKREAVLLEEELELMKVLEDYPDMSDKQVTLRVADSGCNYISLEWDLLDIPQISGYQITRVTSKGDTHIADVPADTYSYELSALKIKRNYTFKVRAYIDVDGTEDGRIYTQYSPEIVVRTGVPTGKLNSVESSGYNVIKLTWDAYKDVTGYRIFRADTKTGKYTRIAIVDGPDVSSYYDRMVQKGKKYYYKVRAYKNIAGKEYYGPLSEILGTKSIIPKPDGFAVNRVDEASAQLSWEGVENVKGYRIYRSEEGEDTFTMIKIVKAGNTAFTDTGLETGKKYQYRIRAYVSIDGKNAYGKYTDILGISSAATGNGIDVSKWQGDIDWDKVREAGVEFAMLRISYGFILDTKFEENYKKAREAGIKVGAYCFNTATDSDEALRQAEYVLSVLDGRDMDYPIVLDVESDNYNPLITSMTNEERTDIAEIFKNEIEEAGYSFMLYANLNWLTTKFVDERLEDWNLWIARYCDLELGHRYNGSGNIAMWQYTDQGIVDGINGSVDLDIRY